MRSTASPILAASVLALSACAPRGADRPLVTVRFLDRIAQAESDGPAGSATFTGRRPAAVGSAPESPRVASIGLRYGRGSERRTAFVTRPGETLSWQIDLSDAMRLRLGLGVQVPETAGDASLRFGVWLARSGEEPLRLVDETVASGLDPGWRDIDVPLPPAGAGSPRAVLQLRAEGPDSGLATWAVPELAQASADDPRTNLILVSLDTLRADRLGAYGYRARRTSPNLDAFAAGAIRFESAIAQAPWTRPSHRAMLSGVHPISDQGAERVPIASILWRNGYRTAAVTGGGQVDPSFGFEAGFESYISNREWLREPLERALGRVESDHSRPFFLFLHTYEIHDPYTDTRFLAPGDCPRLGDRFSYKSWGTLRNLLTAAEKECVGALYDGDIAFADEWFGRLLARLEGSGRLEDTIVVVTSDHGEQFWEHGSWFHGRTLFEHQVHVPLLVHLPPSLRQRLLGRSGGNGAMTVSEPVALVDLAPSLYELLALRAEHTMNGRSFLPLLSGERTESRELLSENLNIRRFERKSLRTERFKFIRTFPVDGKPFAPPEFLLFDLRRDPGERTDLAARYPAALAMFTARLDAITGGKAGARDEEVPEGIDAKLREELRALGYVGN